MTAPIPVTLLTGFLGAGKTTLLNRILTERHGEKIAVIENEFGEVGIDNALLRSGDEQIVEMNNGCLCCTVRGDLIRILGELADKRAVGTLAFDRVLIETTGLADPGPVAQTFFLDERIATRYRLDAVITIVDAVHAMHQLDANEQAQQQVGFADRLLLAKTDLVAAAQVESLAQRLKRINPRAPILLAHFGQTPLGEILDIHGFNLDARLEIDPALFSGKHHHHHDDRIGSFVFRAQRDFDGDRLQDFFGDVVRLYGVDLLRYKGRAGGRPPAAPGHRSGRARTARQRRRRAVARRRGALQHAGLHRPRPAARHHRARADAMPGRGSLIGQGVA